VRRIEGHKLYNLASFDTAHGMGLLRMSGGRNELNEKNEVNKKWNMLKFCYNYWKPFFK
jgi:hypothetical protein